MFADDTDRKLSFLSISTSTVPVAMTCKCALAKCSCSNARIEKRLQTPLARWLNA